MKIERQKERAGKRRQVNLEDVSVLKKYKKTIHNLLPPLNIKNVEKKGDSLRFTIKVSET